ncbi:MAG: hypothetical protein ACXW04_04415 [Methylobacter sp.]|jgi:hypothetical protein
MQAIEIKTYIDDNHQIHLQLPEDWPKQQVKVIVVLEPENRSQPGKRKFGQFRGKIRVAEDFDAELSDEFWLGQGM